MVTPRDAPRAAVSLSTPVTIPSWPLCQRDQIPAPSLIQPRSLNAAVPAWAQSGHVQSVQRGSPLRGDHNGKVCQAFRSLCGPGNHRLAPSRPHHVGQAEQCINTRLRVTEVTLFRGHVQHSPSLERSSACSALSLSMVLPLGTRSTI
jgi:hypothetical protein